MEYERLNREELIAEIRRARAYAYRMSLLGQLIEESSLARSETDVFHIAARYVSRILDADRCSVALLDDSGAFFRIVALDGNEGAIPRGGKIPIEGTAIGTALREKRLVTVQDATASDYADQKMLNSLGKAFFTTPLQTGDFVIGTLNAMRKEAFSIHPDDEALIVHIATLLAAHIEDRRLFEQVRESLAVTAKLERQQRVINEMTRDLRSAKTYAAIFQAVGGSIRKLYDCSRLSMALASDDLDVAELYAVENGDESGFRFETVALEGTLLRRCMTERQVFRINNGQRAEDFGGRTLYESGGVPTIVVPMIADTRVIGTINLGRATAESFIEEDELALLHIASFVAVQLDSLQKSRQLVARAGELIEANGDLKMALQERDARASELKEALDRNQEILSITSHDLKNPLGGIIGLSEMIVEDTEDREDLADIHENAKLIHEEAERMLGIITDLLDRHRQGESIELRYEVCDLGRLAFGSVRTNERQAKAKNIKVIYARPDEPAAVRGDRSALMRVIDNLLSNAVKYSPPDTTVRVDLSHSVGENGRWELSIQDEGPGLTEEDHQRVFGKMARLSARPTGGEHSSGLGLYVARELVERMGGQIGVVSVAGKGARFWFSLPVYHGVADVSMPA